MPPKDALGKYGCLKCEFVGFVDASVITVWEMLNEESMRGGMPQLWYKVSCEKCGFEIVGRLGVSAGQALLFYGAKHVIHHEPPPNWLPPLSESVIQEYANSWPDTEAIWQELEA